MSLGIDNTIVSDAGEMSEVFAEYFGSIFKTAVTYARSHHQRAIARVKPLCITYDIYSDSCKLNMSRNSCGDGVYSKTLNNVLVSYHIHYLN